MVAAFALDSRAVDTDARWSEGRGGFRLSALRADLVMSVDARQRGDTGSQGRY